jgi:hypothetical protein
MYLNFKGFPLILYVFLILIKDMNYYSLYAEFILEKKFIAYYKFLQYLISL